MNNLNNSVTYLNKKQRSHVLNQKKLKEHTCIF